ncbi:Fungal specific transcription factor domain-containing protein [Cladophialophora immunda]|nr:Fungal specific transcription factor domain-containing protein [Cladophialophora immunda]
MPPSKHNTIDHASLTTTFTAPPAMAQRTTNGTDLPRPSTTASHQSYLGEQSLMSYSSPSASVAPSLNDSFAEIVNDEFMKVTGAASLPPEKRVEAYAEAFFKYVYHRMAIIDRSDLQTDRHSLLLSQALCLVGTLLRHPRGTSPLHSGEIYYVRAKTLLSVNHERDHLTILKSLCLLACWNVTPATMVSLDGSWHWIGLAIRLALQIGIHKDATCSQLPNAGVARRIAWYLFSQDKFQTAYFGRPMCMQPKDFDVRRLRLEDFETPDEQAEIFMEYTRLASILGGMLETQRPEYVSSMDKDLGILESLRNWVHELPPHIQLYDTRGRKVYRRDVYEIHIIYFVNIIMFHLCVPAVRSTATSIAALVASSCLARLYEEIEWRDDINYFLSVHHWYVMVACVPQAHYSASLYDPDNLCTEELNIFIKILEQMRTKWPAVETLLKKVERLRQSPLGQMDNGSGHMGTLQDGTASSGSVPMSTIAALFPFPSSVCPRMGLLEEDITQQGDFSLIAAQAFSDEDLDRFFAEIIQ